MNGGSVQPFRLKTGFADGDTENQPDGPIQDGRGRLPPGLTRHGGRRPRASEGDRKSPAVPLGISSELARDPKSWQVLDPLLYLEEFTLDAGRGVNDGGRASERTFLYVKGVSLHGFL